MDTSEDGLRGGGGTASVLWFGRSLVSAAILFGVLLRQNGLHFNGCHFYSSALVLLCGVFAGMPMKVVSMLACRELLRPTFGKRAAARETASSVMKRPAMAASVAGSSTDVPDGATAVWQPAEHDLYLREQLVVNPCISHRELATPVERDYGVVPAERALRTWRETAGGVNLTIDQLSLYSEWLQATRREDPHLPQRTLLTKFMRW